MQQLSKLLLSIDGKGYKAYKDIQGHYRFDGFDLSIDHVQGDPFAAPSRVSVRVPMAHAQLPLSLWQPRDGNTIRKIALEDYLGRHCNRIINKIAKGHRGGGNSGLIAIETSAQQILPRNAVILQEEFVEARIVMGLPANGRRIAGRQAHEMFMQELPNIVKRALRYESLDANAVQQHIECAEDQDALRRALSQQQLVAFIADDALLPRASGISDKPLNKDALAFRSPESLRVSITLPHAGTITGMGIPAGVTLIVGGGFHGKSTLLHAIERGVYNHIPGDGREKVVTEASAVKVRAEDGRAISKVNISPFIDRLPFNRNTVAFTTENASGSTSQAANIIEALECGTKLLLIDEDTSATNFMIRDERMQALVRHEKEPITPLVARIRELYTEHSVSSIIVMGGSGDYFDVADTVIMMDCYEPQNVTTEARALSRERSHEPNSLTASGDSQLAGFSLASQRKPGPSTLDASRKNRDVKIDTKDLHTLLYGEHRIDLALVEQLIDFGQTRSIGLMILYYAQHYARPMDSLMTGLQRVMQDVEQQGLDIISPYKVGNLTMPRLYELAAAINRIRGGQWL